MNGFTRKAVHRTGALFDAHHSLRFSVYDSASFACDPADDLYHALAAAGDGVIDGTK